MHKFRDNVLESSQNISETTFRHSIAKPDIIGSSTTSVNITGIKWSHLLIPQPSYFLFV